MGYMAKQHDELIKIFNDVYNEKGRLFASTESGYDNSSKIYGYLNRLIVTKKINGIENILIDNALNKIEDISDRYTKTLDLNEKVNLIKSNSLLTKILQCFINK